MVRVAAVFGVALAPSLLWLWYFWSREQNREEARPLARAFLWGMVAFLPALILELALSGLFGVDRMGSAGVRIMVETVLLVGPIEEICKYLAARHALRDEPAFDEPSDGIVYAGSTALGFAFVENMFYLADLNPVVICLRSVIAVPGHVLFAAWWGAAMGRHRFVPGTPYSVVQKGVLYAALMHGFYDAFAFGAQLWGGALLCLAATVVIMWRKYHGMMAEAAAHVAPRAMGMDPHPQRPDVPEVMLEPVDYGFRWRWVWISTVLGLVMTVSGLFALGFLMAMRNPELAQPGALQPEAASVLIAALLGLTSGGVLSAYLSPGRTVRETSVGLAFLGGLIGVGSAPQVGMAASLVASFVFMIPFGLIGAFAGWLGESISEPPLRRSGPPAQ